MLCYEYYSFMVIEGNKNKSIFQNVKVKEKKNHKNFYFFFHLKINFNFENF